MEKTEKKPHGAGRPSKLTAGIIEKLVEMWGLSDERCLSDAEICRAIGIEPKQLENWLTYDTGGISGIRAGARGSVKVGYLSKLNEIAKKAFDAEDFDIAAKIYCWLLEKQFPREFGRLVKVAATTSRDWIETATDDELNAFIEENKKLLETPERPAGNE